MRITNPTILRGYHRNLNNLMSAKTRTMQKIMSGRSFARASENPISAAKALKVRKQLMNTTQFRENLEVADKFYNEAETSLLEVSDQLATIRETIIAAVNTTKDKPTDLQIYAQQLETKGRELCSIFNTNTAERMIFGGESDDPQPFTIENDENGNALTVLYHGVPVNAYSSSSNFPYSKDVLMDIGLGMVVNQDTQDIDPQSTLRISFNGASVTGCGAEKGVADIDLSSIRDGSTYTLDVYAGDVKKTITVKGRATHADTKDAIQEELNKAFRFEKELPQIDDSGIISVKEGTVCVTNNPYSDPDKMRQVKIENMCGYGDKYAINVKNLGAGKNYAIKVKAGDVEKTVSFTGQDTPENTVDEINKQLEDAFGTDQPVRISADGIISSEGVDVKVTSAQEDDSGNKAPVTRDIIRDYTIDATKFKNDNTDIILNVNIDGNETTVNFKMNAVADPEAFISGELAKQVGLSINNGELVTNGKKVSIKVVSGVDADGVKEKQTITSRVDFDKLTEGTQYSMKVSYNGTNKMVVFKAGANATESREALKKALAETPEFAKIDVAADGVMSAADGSVTADSQTAAGDLEVKRQQTYSNNYIQLTLDAARALRNGDIEYANGCIDRIVSASENLLLEIADLGCNEEFIEFNDSRFVSRQYNLQDRQKTLEATDYEKEITLMKQYEAIYNATLQMASQVVPNSIFNYIN